MRKKQSGQVSHRLFLDLRDIGYFGHITLTRWVFRNLLTKYIGLENVNFCLKTIFFNLWRNFQLKELLSCWAKSSYFSLNVTLTRILCVYIITQILWKDQVFSIYFRGMRFFYITEWKQLSLSFLITCNLELHRCHTNTDCVPQSKKLDISK